MGGHGTRLLHRSGGTPYSTDLRDAEVSLPGHKNKAADQIVRDCGFAGERLPIAGKP